MDERHTWIALLVLSFVLHGALLHIKLLHPPSVEGNVPVILETMVPEQRTSDGISFTAEMAPLDGNNQGEDVADKRRRAFAEYLKQIRRTIETNKFYSAGRDASDLIGRAPCRLTVTGDGAFTHVRLLRSSGDPRLDQAALSAIRVSSAKVKRPPITGDTPLSLRVTVKYQYGL
ncbi:TonB family protein [Desulfoplanes sp.]